MVSQTTSKVINNKRGNKIEDMSINELVGSSVKEFKDYY
jgi:hypothetical protein